jgi:hypothetical protein
MWKAFFGPVRFPFAFFATRRKAEESGT